MEVCIKYNRLTLLVKDTGKKTKDRDIIGLWICDCGISVEKSNSRVKNSYVKSCGCLAKEALKTARRKGKKGHTAWNKGIPNPEMSFRQLGENNPMFGKDPWNKGLKGMQTAWNKGEKHSEETRKRLSISHIGNPSPMKGKKQPKMTGENHPLWKGGATPEAKKIRTSMEYKQWRTAVFERDYYTCQHCGIRGTYLEVDHILPFSLFPEYRLHTDNGRTLCKSCHSKTDTFMGRIKTKTKEDFLEIEKIIFQINNN